MHSAKELLDWQRQMKDNRSQAESRWQKMAVNVLGRRIYYWRITDADGGSMQFISNHLTITSFSGFQRASGTTVDQRNRHFLRPGDALAVKVDAITTTAPQYRLDFREFRGLPYNY